MFQFCKRQSCSICLKTPFLAWKQERIVFLPCFGLVNQIYVQHAGAAYQDSCCLSYRLYFSPPTYEIRDGVILAYEVGKKAAAQGFLVAFQEFSLHPVNTELLVIDEYDFNKIASQIPLELSWTSMEKWLANRMKNLCYVNHPSGQINIKPETKESYIILNLISCHQSAKKKKSIKMKLNLVFLLHV